MLEASPMKDKLKKGDLMEKKKKIILISVSTIIILLIIGGIVWYFVVNNNVNRDSNNQTESSKVSELYNMLKERNGFSFEAKLNEEEYLYYSKLNNMAYINTVYEGRMIKNLIKDGNTYLLVDATKTYYTYSNNQTNLNMVIKSLERVKDLEYETGRERVNDTNCSYEEYIGLTNFAMGDFTEDTEDVKTRFYFDGDELVYIKTIEGEKEELLKVDISYDVDTDLFQIPSNYKKA